MNNIKYKDNLEKKLITRYLKYLWDKKTFINLKIIAIEYLSQFSDDDEILEKLKYFEKNESNKTLKGMLQRAIDGVNLFELSIKESEDDTENIFTLHSSNNIDINQEERLKPLKLNYQNIALLKSTYKNRGN